MRLLVPLTKEKDERIEEYIHRCDLMLISFRSFLRSYIRPDKLSCRNVSLIHQPNITWIYPQKYCNTRQIVDLYISKLQCIFDRVSESCYFEVPKSVRCPGTVTPLNVVMRTLEYGGKDMPPLFWLRPTYRHFIETTTITQNKHN